MHESLKEKLKHLPQEPGIYMMKDQSGTIIYVGKAKILRNRVRSYFVGFDAKDLKTKGLVQQITDFDIILTKNETEALLLERTLIRHHHPRYNILLKDGKEYPYLRVDFQEDWPRLEKVRRRSDDKAFYLGPFSNAGSLHTTMKLAQRIFPSIRCTRYEFKNAKRPCNYYHMKMCLGPCTLPVERDLHIQTIKDTISFLLGKNRELIQDIKSKMQQAAAEEAFEKAAQFRDQMFALEEVSKRQTVVIKDLQDGDAIGLHRFDGAAAFCVMMVREGRLIGNDSFVLSTPMDNAEETLRSFLIQYYDQRLLPGELLLPHELEDSQELIKAIQEAQKDFQTQSTIINVPKRGPRWDLMEMARKNAQYHAEETERHRHQSHVELELLQRLLKLERLPQRIECIDISNLQGTHVVGSDVCFIDAKPAKELYRYYTIKDLAPGEQNDFASIEEVVTRRIRRGIEQQDLPDLLVIDGGKGQLNAALKAKASYPGLDLTIVSLAKSRTLSDTNSRDVRHSYERVFVPGEDVAIPLKPGSPEFRLLTRLRDEAHRFAITQHRKKRSKAFVGSSLDQIPGLGKVLRQRLLQHFGDLAAIRAASPDELRKVAGVSEKLALRIRQFLNSSHST